MGPATKRPGRTRARPHRSPGFVAVAPACAAIVSGRASPFALTAGEFKTPFTREYRIAIPALELADLATAIDSLAPKYDVGVMGEMSLGASAGLALGVFNGEGANAIANRDSTVMIVSRATVRPLPNATALPRASCRVRPGPAYTARMRCHVDLRREGPEVVARCAEFPACTGRGHSRDAALERLRDSVLFWLEACPCDTTADGGLQFEVVRDA